jgi:hypothetical protein
MCEEKEALAETETERQQEEEEAEVIVEEEEKRAQVETAAPHLEIDDALTVPMPEIHIENTSIESRKCIHN